MTWNLIKVYIFLYIFNTTVEFNIVEKQMLDKIRDKIRHFICHSMQTMQLCSVKPQRPAARNNKSVVDLRFTVNGKYFHGHKER